MQIALTVSAKSEMKQECGEGWLFLGSGGVSRDKRLSTSLISHPVQRLLQQVLPYLLKQTNPHLYVEGIAYELDAICF